MTNNIVHLSVSVPVASFRIPYAREYWETYPCPPPSTVYGMLLSLVGEGNRLEHQGADIALALLSWPQRSIVLRTLWRVKNKQQAAGTGTNARPDFQELLTNVKLALWIRQGRAEAARVPLIKRLRDAIAIPQNVRRFGGLALGESTHLVDEVRLWRHEDAALQGRLLVRDETGRLAMPIWPDHLGSSGTRWEQFRLTEVAPIPGEPRGDAWITLAP